MNIRAISIEIYLLFAMYILFFCTINCDNNKDILDNNKEVKDKLVRDNVINFIDYDYEFQNESLNRPFRIKYNNKSEEFIILDEGNNCFYIFSKLGKFVRKIGVLGQGPGEMINPRYFTIDNLGYILVYESGNQRISKYSMFGEYISSFRVKTAIESKTFLNMTVNSSNNLVLNIPRRGYYLTIMSQDGKFIKDIGNIERFDTENANQRYASGFVFTDKNEHYYIFLTEYKKVKKFTFEGELIKEINILDNIRELIPLKETATPDPYSKTISGIRLIQDIVFFNDCFHIMKFDFSIKDWKQQNFEIFILNDNLEHIDTINLKFPEPFKKDMRPMGFDIIENYDIFLAIPQISKVVKFPNN